MTRGAKATGLRGPEARGGTGGFSASNLWRMKGFFENYRDAVKLAPLPREVGWSTGPENLNAEAVRLAAVIKRNFEELGI